MPERQPKASQQKPRRARRSQPPGAAGPRSWPVVSVVGAWPVAEIDSAQAPLSALFETSQRLGGQAEATQRTGLPEPSEAFEAFLEAQP